MAVATPHIARISNIYDIRKHKQGHAGSPFKKSRQTIKFLIKKNENEEIKNKQDGNAVVSVCRYGTLY